MDNLRKIFNDPYLNGYTFLLWWIAAPLIALIGAVAILELLVILAPNFSVVSFLVIPLLWVWVQAIVIRTQLPWELANWFTFSAIGLIIGIAAVIAMTIALLPILTDFSIYSLAVLQVLMVFMGVGQRFSLQKYVDSAWYWIVPYIIGSILGFSLFFNNEITDFVVLTSYGLLALPTGVMLLWLYHYHPLSSKEKRKRKNDEFYEYEFVDNPED